MRPAFASIVASSLMVAGAARADAPAKLDVTWQAPVGCPTYRDVESWLQAVIPPDARERSSELHVKVIISGSAEAGYAASVQVARDASPVPDTRVVEGRACEEVARSAIVVVSVTMSDALKAESPTPSASASTQTQEPPPAPPPRLVAPPVTTSVPRAPVATSRAEWLASGEVGVGSGFATQPGIRLDASLMYELGESVVLGPRLHSVPAVTVRRGEEVAKLHLIAAGLQACWLPALATWWRAGACTRAEAGLAWARGAGEEATSDASPVAALALTPRASFGGRLRLVVEGDVEMRLLRPRFETSSGEVLTKLPLLAGSGLLGLELALH